VGGVWKDLPSAISASFTFANLTPQDAGSYRCYVTGPGACADSAAAVLTVTPGDWVACTGFLKVERFDGIGNTDVGSLWNSAAYQNDTPNFSGYIPGAIYAPNLDNYGVRMSGYLVPSETADYTFADESDDSSVVYVSSDDNIANATKTVEQLGCCATVMGATHHLVAGQKYAFLAFYKEGGGGDNLNVYWKNNASMPVLTQIGPMDVASYAAPAPISVDSFSGGGTVNAGGTFTFTVNASSAGALSYQWQKQVGGVWKNLPGASAPSYSVFNANPTDAGSYQCYVFTPGGCAQSAVATLTVANAGDLVLCNGQLRVDLFANIGNTDIGSLVNSAAYQVNSPTLTAFTTQGSEWPQTNPDLGNYGIRMSGYLIPSETADYTFSDLSDDSSQVFVSTDDNIANARIVVRQDGCCGVVTANGTMHLVAGQKYAFVAFMKEGGGGDYLHVYWQNNASITGATLIPPANVACNIVPSAILAQPQSQTVAQNQLVTLEVVALGAAPSYQWQKDSGAGFQDVPGANKGFLRFTGAQPGDSATYRCKVGEGACGVVSDSAVLTVVGDTDSKPALLMSAEATDGGMVIGLCFDEPVTDPTASNPANYSINGGAFGDNIAAVLRPGANTMGVVLVLASPVSGSFTVKAQGVLDNQGLPCNTSIGGSQAFFSDADIGLAPGAGNPAPVGGSFTCNGTDFEVSAGGDDIWGDYDSAHFVYTQLTGDFIAQARIDRLDNQNYWSKAGMMARTTLDAHSDQIDTYFTPTTGANNVESGVRSAVIYPDGGDPQTHDWGIGCSALCNIGSSGWIKLQRVTNPDTTIQFHGYHSADGLNWIEHATTPALPAGLVIPDTLYVGMIVTSHNNGTATIADYSHVYIGQTITGFLNIVRKPNGDAFITWTGGRLESAPAVTGPWTDTGFSPPSKTLTPAPTGNKFYRVISP